MRILEILKNIINNPGSAFFYTPSIYKKSKSYFFTNPYEKITANNKEQLESVFSKIDNNINNGLVGFGQLKYELGYLLENKLNVYHDKNSESLLDFYFFEKKDVIEIESSKIDFFEVDKLLIENKYKIEKIKLNSSKKDYVNGINKIKEEIKVGNTYQVNYTVKGKFSFNGSITSLFLQLLFDQSAKYSALINNNDNFVISISPELFFDFNGNEIIARPMKGTIKRGYNLNNDLDKISVLRNSKKDTSENVMILDLLRNDLGRISEINSVKTFNEYEIEKYESLFQMTSSVKSKLINPTFSNIVKNIFPCGSITGAPKISTMEIIKKLENEKRGLYTGAIGITKKNKFKFNVPIRTIILNKNGKGEIGIGSGVVWDSKANEEYEETLLKSKFLTNPQKYFELFESILFENGELFLFEEHLQRLKSSSEFFLFNFSYSKVKNEILEFCKKLDKTKKHKIKYILNKWGITKISSTEIKIEKNIKREVIISKIKINSKNKFQYFKTTNREIYNTEYQNCIKNEYYDVIFFNEKNELCEGAITNILVEKKMKFSPHIYPLAF